MFPHTITIYIYDESSGKYTRQIVDGVYWTGNDNVSINEVRNHSNNVTIVVPKELMNQVNVINGCYIAKGNQPEITSMQELENMTSIQVSSIQINDSGWDVDNITINGS